MMICDLYLHLPIALNKGGSYYCVFFFLFLDNMKHKHNFCIREAIKWTLHIGWTQQNIFEANGTFYVESKWQN
jgi:hypothetical protein